MPEDFTRIFASTGIKATITDSDYNGGWVPIVGDQAPDTPDFNAVMNEQDRKLAELNDRSANLVTSSDIPDADATLTAAQLIGGEFTITPTAARTLTTDTAANIIAELTGSVDNSNFEFTIINSGVFDATLVEGAGVTLVGSMIVNGAATFRFRRLTSSSASVTRLNYVHNQKMIVVDQKASGTAGGTITGTGWRTRDLNFVIYNNIVGASLLNDVITLPLGKYQVSLSAPINGANRHKVKLTNIDDTIDYIGTSESSVGSTTRSFLDCVFSILSEKNFKVFHYSQSTVANSGFGLQSSFGVDEIYTQISIEKIG